MSSDLRTPPTGDEPSPLDAYRAPSATGAPPPRTIDLGPVVPWGLADVVVVALLYIGASIFVGRIVARLLGVPAVESAKLTPDEWMLMVLSSSVGSLAALAVVMAWLRLAARATWRDMGWRDERWPSNVLQGFVAFLVLMLPVFGLQALLNFLYEQAFGPPEQHRLIRHLLDHPGDTAFLIAGFTAVIAAPLTEEFLFRSVLQGWLQRLAIEGRKFSQPAGWGEEPRTEETTTPPPDRPLLVWPIVVTSLLFAVMHLSAGVSCIPLFFFSLGLGYLYQRTQSLVAPLVLHISLNTTTMLVLWLSTR